MHRLQWHAGVVLTCGKDNLLKLTDWRSFQVQRTLRAPGFHVGGVWCRACIGADEHHAAAGSADGTLHIWSVSLLKGTLPCLACH